MQRDDPRRQPLVGDRPAAALTEAVGPTGRLEQMLAGVSTRRFERTREPVGDQVEEGARSTSKSAVSREVVARTRENFDALMARRLDDVRLAVMMIDGIDLKAPPTSSPWGSPPE